MNYGHWDISQVGDFDPDDYFGFTYLVTNMTTGRMYIGKKQFTFKTRKTVKKVSGVGRKTVLGTKASDWQLYTTSSEHVNNDISGGHSFKFEILKLYKTKSGLGYGETEAMVYRDVLRSLDGQGNRQFYNGQIPAVRGIPKE